MRISVAAPRDAFHAKVALRQFPGAQTHASIPTWHGFRACRRLMAETDWGAKCSKCRISECKH